MSASATVAIYIDTTPAENPRAELNDVNPEKAFATVELVDTPGGRVYIALRSHAEADALMRAVADAADLLAEAAARGDEGVS
jgi:hypothetical protein